VTYGILLAASGLLLAPLAIPLLRPETFSPIRSGGCTSRLQKQKTRAPVRCHKSSPMNSAGRIWCAKTAIRLQQPAAGSARPHRHLPPTTGGRGRCHRLLRPEVRPASAPSASINSYLLWGPARLRRQHRDRSRRHGKGDREQFSDGHRDSGQKADNPWSREDEHFTIWLLPRIEMGLRAVWPKIKKWGFDR